MGANSKIEWTHHTFNPWRGCAKVSPGCANCYADAQAKRNPQTLGVWGPQGTRVVASQSMWREPLRWDAKAEAAGERRRVFCASMADVFEDWSGGMIASQGDAVFLNASFRASRRQDHRLTMQDVRGRLWGLISETPFLDWLLLTKRIENVAHFAPSEWFDASEGRGAWPENVWLGVSVEDQQRADERIPHLLRTPAAVRFLSIEPLLGPLDLTPYLCPHSEGEWLNAVECGKPWSQRINWVIVGGESGPNARPIHPAWVRDIRDQCQAAGVSFFFKQWGEWAPWTTNDAHGVFGVPDSATNHAWPDTSLSLRVGKRAAGRQLDGREWSEFPQPARWQ